MSALPEQIGKYRVQALLGQGAMGTVYLAQDPDMERRVAIKVVHPHLAAGEGNQDWRERFRQEARAAARCLHPNVVTVFDFGTDGASDYLVMEYVQGEELRFFIETGHRFALHEILHIAREVLAALDHAHAKGVVHRDIKPANIILLDTGGVKVADFGVARIDASELTQAGNMVGTPSYMAPEGLRGEQVTAAGDLYSVGIVLLEMLTGRKPGPEVVFGHKVSAFVDEAFDSEAARELPPRLRGILARVLAADPEQRPESALGLARQLEQVGAEVAGERNAVETLSETVIAREPLRRPEPAASPTATWPAELVDRLRSRLATHVGPLAAFIVNQSLSNAGSVTELGEQLAARIPATEGREQFLAWFHRCALEHACSGEHGVADGSAAPAEPEAPAFSPDGEELDRIIRLYARHVGPIARRMVEMTLPRAMTREAFIQALCERIPDEAERQAFRRALTSS
ncbi:serine/threonine-protein kinase [Thiohalobacter sp.]|uniref:serine/threonine-protein kinase n=1 Tax=Thiohalobacter sp. TaxID=2025948 RepID=UPI00261085A9|nr:serine/threonine-protein kinase [Thiohalobacter sp.]